MRIASLSGSRTPTSDIKSTLRPIADLVQADLKQAGHEVVTSRVLEMVAAAFGFYKFELMLRSQPVLQIHTPAANHGEFSQLRPESVQSRATELLKVDQWTAMRIASVVIDRVRKSGLTINALEAYIRQGDATETILGALGSGADGFSPVNATVAMRAGLIRSLPADAPLIMPKPDRLGRLGGWADIAKALIERDVRVWQWPDVAAGDISRLSVRDAYLHSPLNIDPQNKFGGAAEMGLGFTLISVEPYLRGAIRVGTSHSLWTPVRDCRQDANWRTLWHSGGWIHDPSKPERFRGYSLAAEVSDLPVASFCKVCRQIFADGVTGALAHRPHVH